MYAVRGIFDGQSVVAVDPIPIHNQCDVVITFLEYSVVPPKAVKIVNPKEIPVAEKTSALESLVGIAQSETPMLAEVYAKEERLARQ